MQRTLMGAARDDIAIGEGAALYWTHGPSRAHRPHIIKVLASLTTPLIVTLPEHGLRIESSRPIVIDADTIQAVESEGPRFTVFFDPETAGWPLRRWFRAAQVPLLPLPTRYADSMTELARRSVVDTDVFDGLAEFRDALEGWELGADAPLPRVVRDAAATLVMDPSCDRDHLARALELTPRQLSREFREFTGLTLRRYGQWTKVARAIIAACHGVSFGQIGTIAGFSDQSHFSRSLRELLGSSPSEVPFARATVHGNYYAGLGPRAEDFVASLDLARRS